MLTDEMSRSFVWLPSVVLAAVMAAVMAAAAFHLNEKFFDGILKRLCHGQSW